MVASTSTAADSPSEIARPIAGRLVLWLIVVLYLATATAYNLAVPAGEAPDEIAHIDYVGILQHTWQLPTIPKGSARYSYEAEQPPLYYVIGAIWMGILWHGDSLRPDLQPNPAFSFDKLYIPNAYLHNYPAEQEIPVHLLRLVSTIMGLATLLLTWWAARIAWPADMPAAALATGFIALMPGFSFTAGTVTNDALATAGGAAVTLASVALLQQGVSLWLSALSGAALGAGLLGKRSLLALLPITLLVPFVSQARDRKSRFMGAILALLAAALVGVWPFVSNMVEYGDPFATAATEAAKPEIAQPLQKVPGFWLSPRYFVSIFNSLWGIFGLRHIDLPEAIYVLYYLVCLVAIVGVAWQWRTMPSVERLIVLVLALIFLLINAGVAYQNTQFWAPQGRLLLPGLTALALLVGRGISVLASKAPARVDIRARRLPIAALLLVFLLIDWYALVSHIILLYK